MKERPILMSSPMVQALLAGRKTQTRRAIKPQPELSTAQWYYDSSKTGMWMAIGPASTGGTRQTWGWKPCPYGQAGDRLYVKETQWCNGGYVATDPPPFAHAGKIPSIFMPRHYSRIDLEITDIRVERVQDISLFDCEAEGCAHIGPLSALGRYREVWESINGRGSWKKNPWVWVISFKRI